MMNILLWNIVFYLQFGTKVIRLSMIILSAVMVEWLARTLIAVDRGHCL